MNGPVVAAKADGLMMPYPAGTERRTAKVVRSYPSSALTFATPAAGGLLMQGLVLSSLVHAILVILRPRPTCRGITAKRVVAVTDGSLSLCCILLDSCCCNPPDTRAGPPVPTLIHVKVVIRLPCPTRGRAPDGCIATITRALLSSCRVLTDSCCCSPPGAWAVYPFLH